MCQAGERVIKVVFSSKCLQQGLSVDLQMKAQTEEIRGFSAQDHSVQEDLEIVHDSADGGVDAQGERDGGGLGIQKNFGVLYGVVDPVVDVEGGKVVVSDTAAADIGLIAENDGSSHGVDGECGGVIVMADGGDDGGNLFGGHSHAVQNAESHVGAAEGVVGAVDDIADVVHIGGDLGQFHFAGGELQCGQNTGGYICAAAYVGEGMLGEAQGGERYGCLQTTTNNLAETLHN